MSKSKTLVERITSGFKKIVAVSTFALAGLMPSSCVPEDQPLYHRNIAHSVSDYARKKFKEGNPEAGIKYLKEAAEIHKPDMFDAHKLGIHYKKEGNVEKAEKYLRIATGTDMRDKNLNDKIKEIRANAFFELGKIHSEKEENEKALYFSKRAAQIDKDNEEYKGLLEKMTKKKGSPDIKNSICFSGGQADEGDFSYGIDYILKYNKGILTVGVSILENDRDYENDSRFSWTKEIGLHLGGGVIITKNEFGEFFLIGTMGYSSQEVPIHSSYYLEKDEYTTYSILLGGISKDPDFTGFFGYSNRRFFLIGGGFNF
ncbi:hypothetical protein KY342_06005 [Candidatus Woesearchaeota archaeon]|nr:hypothetical protein [Candidatus Woesearchaeota archaeon]